MQRSKQATQVASLLPSANLKVMQLAFVDESAKEDLLDRMTG